MVEYVAQILLRACNLFSQFYNFDYLIIWQLIAGFKINSRSNFLRKQVYVYWEIRIYDLAPE